MKSLLLKCVFVSAVIFLQAASYAQQKNVDSLQQLLENAEADSVRLDLYRKISFELRVMEPDKSEEYARKGLALAREKKMTRAEAQLYISLGLAFFYQSEFD